MHLGKSRARRREGDPPMPLRVATAAAASMAAGAAARCGMVRGGFATTLVQLRRPARGQGE